MKKGDIVVFKNPLPDEVGQKFKLLENPESGRVLAEAIVDMLIRPTYILKDGEIVLFEEDFIFQHDD